MTTARELIAELSELPPDREVLVFDASGKLCVCHASLATILPDGDWCIAPEVVASALASFVLIHPAVLI